MSDHLGLVLDGSKVVAIEPRDDDVHVVLVLDGSKVASIQGPAEPVKELQSRSSRRV